MYDIQRAVFDSSFAAYRPTSTSCWFYALFQLTTIEGIANLNTSEVTDMSYTFLYCSELEGLDLSSLNTSKVTDMNHMFCGCKKMSHVILDNFDTSNVTNMARMFDGTEGLESLDVSSFNTSKVTDMSGMFAGVGATGGCETLNLGTCMKCSKTACR